MALTLNPAWLEALMLASVRMIAFFVVAPPFSYNGFPIRIKAMLGLGLALAVSPRVASTYKSPDTAGFITALVLEIVVGATLGFLVMLIFSAIQSAGSLIDMFGGFQMAQAFDPQAMLNGAQFTRLFQMTSLALLFVTDGYQLVIGGMIRSFTALPLGGGINLSHPIQAMTAATGQMFLAAVQIAGPLLVVLFLADVGLGLLTRVAPALNAFALGFPLKIFLTLTLAGAVYAALPRIVAALAGQAFSQLSGGG
ncbi:flagellar biosynthetic protein FliR [Paeniglutamicibacter antarcticus]|uniref:Flagellar biosynthetic protein FliR n=1 Tax=Arthrobacter terrae TaxID=2935737 RepID=A0A931G665_9MICC|nr:flagellar biosynthetic protein FliR [Arthrobacter terrae]MBG0740305.1 flagellar biosynthetic protein FliR [Arthrobacter terrae]